MLRKFDFCMVLVFLVQLGFTAARADTPPPKFGVYLAFSENKAIVTSLVPGSIAEQMGVSNGDQSSNLTLRQSITNLMQMHF